ncbi:hypothetical protein [Phyllobacterium sophorae]|uniref:Uncharacterized protein n=1 Tax=Phyllobacterium sophorae TaxID=1520277 RepID=A0A2P7AQE0_9HYPH|nr:hypothetical protein [Phyllobacterium sophorae]PSH56353.1 hypothetical protein CU103_30035 [Phyllobacterium sophorae]
MVISFDANNIDTYMARGDAYTRLVRVLSKRPLREAEFIAAEKAVDAGAFSAATRKIGRHQVISQHQTLFSMPSSMFGKCRRYAHEIQTEGYAQIVA